MTLLSLERRLLRWHLFSSTTSVSENVMISASWAYIVHQFQAFVQFYLRRVRKGQTTCWTSAKWCRILLDDLQRKLLHQRNELNVSNGAWVTHLDFPLSLTKDKDRWKWHHHYCQKLPYWPKIIKFEQMRLPCNHENGFGEICLNRKYNMVPSRFCSFNVN